MKEMAQSGFIICFASKNIFRNERCFPGRNCERLGVFNSQIDNFRIKGEISVSALSK